MRTRRVNARHCRRQPTHLTVIHEDGVTMWLIDVFDGYFEIVSTTSCGLSVHQIHF